MYVFSGFHNRRSGDLDGWVKNEVARLKVFHGKRGFVARSPMLKFLANPKSSASYIERLDEGAEQEKLGPVLSLLTQGDLVTSLTKTDCQNDARFVIGHLILSTFVQNDYSLDQYKQVAESEGFAREQMFYLTDQVFCYVGMKLLQEYKSLPRAFLVAAEKFGQQEASSIFARANVKTQFARAFDVFKISHESAKLGIRSNSGTITTASSGPESAGQSSASRDKMVDPEKLH